MQQEPVRIGAAITGLVSAFLVLLVAFGVDLSADQQTAIMGFVGAVIAFAGAMGIGEYIRSKVKPWPGPAGE